MDRRKMKVAVLGLVSILVVAAFLLCSVPQAGAETLKARSVVVATKYETIPVNDEPGHILSMQILEGLALLDNGEIAKRKAYAVSDIVPGKGGQGIVYNTFIFQDGSTIVVRTQRLMVADKSGAYSAKVTGEIIKGTGRFEGIKGTASGTGITYLPSEGEASKVLTDTTLTYTLSGK